MAQETIKLDCIESVYLDVNLPVGNHGKTDNLILQTNRGINDVIENFALLKFDIPNKIKNHKILSCYLHVYCTCTNTGLYHETLFWPGSLADGYESIADDIYTANYSDLLKYTNSVITAQEKTNSPTANQETLWLYQDYPNYTWLNLEFLGYKSDSSSYSPREFWDAFTYFLKNQVAILYVGGSARGNGITTTTINSSRTSNFPYMEIVIDKDFLEVEPNNFSFVDATQPFVFGWSFPSSMYLYDPVIEQKSAEIRIKKSGEDNFTSYYSDENGQYTLPANTLEVGNYEWQIEINTNDERTATSEWKGFTTTDALSDPVIVYPNQIVIDGSQSIKLEWEHVISTGSLPRGFDLQYRKNNGEWQTITEQRDTDAQYYDLPGNTLPSGNVEWRVRTYNSNLVAGNWSNPGVVIVRGASPAPIITQITTQPRPTITWEAEGQIMAQIRIGDIVKTLYSAAKTYKWPDFLPDGPVMVEVRVQNEFGLWSQWGSMTVTIKNQAQEPVAISARIINYSASLSVVSSYPNNYIYRDGVLLGKVSQVDDILSYIDYESVGKHNYQAMGVDEQDNYQMSNMITVIVSLDCGMIGQAQSPEWIMLKRRRGSFPAHSIKTKKPVSLIYYQGKSLPVAHVSESLEVEHTLEFTVDKSTADQLQKLIGESIIYKDVRGDLIVGVMSGIECSRDRSTDVKITIDETQKEVIEIA